MRFEDWLAKEQTKEKVEVVVESTTEQPINEAKKKVSEIENIPYEGTQHDMQDTLDMYKKTNPRLHASILSWD